MIRSGKSLPRKRAHLLVDEETDDIDLPCPQCGKYDLCILCLKFFLNLVNIMADNLVIHSSINLILLSRCFTNYRFCSLLMLSINICIFH